MRFGVLLFVNVGKARLGCFEGEEAGFGTERPNDHFPLLIRIDTLHRVAIVNVVFAGLRRAVDILWDFSHITCAQTISKWPMLILFPLHWYCLAALSRATTF